MELTDAERGRVLVERWCSLAEQRLDYLTDLFETGRWRRFFGEAAFLANIQDAKKAVETWRGLLYREASLDNRPVDLSWLGHNPQLSPRQPIMVTADRGSPPPSPRLADKLPLAPMRESVPPAAADPAPRLTVVAEPAAETAPAIVPDDDIPAWRYALDAVHLEQRYSLLRKAG